MKKPMSLTIAEMAANGVHMTDRRTFIGGCAAASALAGCRILPGTDVTVRFGMIADLHYAEIPPRDVGGPCGDRHYSQSCEKLADFVTAMHRQQPDFLIELGDFKDLSVDKATTLRCLDRIERVFAGFRGSRYHVLGNHDMDCLSKDEFLSHVSNDGGPASPHYSFVVGGMTFVVLDGCFNATMEDYFPGNWVWTDANVPPAQLDWLARTLAAAPGPAVVFCHQRLDDRALGDHAVRNAAEVRRALEESGKVKSVFTGHEHQGGYRRLNGIDYFVQKAAVVDDRDEGENAWSLVSVRADGSAVLQSQMRR